MSEKPGPSRQARDTPKKSMYFKLLRKQVGAVWAENMFGFDYIS
mgnify:CR=1 FL=1